ncbi:MAG: PEGA domain-containing protein, partial [Candidatus Magasanikbacteria bacterium]|nr:PEGA domain-containing protein [Candidatus Magasanikbacteria bacterium]
MFHTKTILTLGVRRFIMVFLITLFFIISPIIILYTAGYTYDTKNHQIKTRGTLSITVVPKKASITLNGIPLPEKTPLRLKHRSPGSYHIIIKKDGYKPWETNSIIESNKTTYLHNIQLFKDQPFTLKIDVEKNQIYPSHNGSHIIIKKDKAETQEGLLFTPQSINPVTL